MTLDTPTETNNNETERLGGTENYGTTDRDIQQLRNDVRTEQIKKLSEETREFESAFPLEEVKIIPKGMSKFALRDNPFQNNVFEVIRTTKSNPESGSYTVFVRRFDADNDYYEMMVQTSGEFLKLLNTTYLNSRELHYTFNLDSGGDSQILKEDQKAVARADIKNFVDLFGDYRFDGKVLNKATYGDATLQEIEKILEHIKGKDPEERTGEKRNIHVFSRRFEKALSTIELKNPNMTLRDFANFLRTAPQS